MRPIRNILVPVDFSQSAQEATNLAADLGRRFEASLTLVHIYQPVMYPLPEGVLLYGADTLNELMTFWQKSLDEWAERARSGGAMRVETRLLQGSAASEIVRYAEERSFDLVVMGTHGRTGIEHALLGSIAEKVVRKAPCPVLTVRSTTPQA